MTVASFFYISVLLMTEYQWKMPPKTLLISTISPTSMILTSQRPTKAGGRRSRPLTAPLGKTEPASGQWLL